MTSPLRRFIPRQRRTKIAVVVAVLALIGGFIATRVAAETTVADGPQPPATTTPTTPTIPAGTTAPATTPGEAAPGTLVCGQPVLRSPFGYHGEPAGHYRSGTPGLPTYGHPGTDFPHATNGVILPTGNNDLASYQAQPDTVYYFLPGTHTGGIQADTNDAFVGGYAGGRPAVMDGRYKSGGQAIDSNASIGDQSGVTVEYLTIEHYTPNPDAAALNQEGNTGWTFRFNTVTENVPGAGIMLGSQNTLSSDCLTRNGQYGFQSADIDGFGKDALTGGPYDLTVDDNEISYNDICDYSGLITNQAMGWHNYNPVPQAFRNPQCGNVQGDGNQGGFKLWETDGVTISHNFIHDNWGPGGWADTDNANTTWADNRITGNEGEGIVEEISYNFAITGNYIADNDWTDGLNNAGFPQPAIYISESGSDTTFGGVPPCPEATCKDQPAYQHKSLISGNTLVNNGGSVFLWQNSNRYCGDGSDGGCTLVAGASHGPFTEANCQRNLPGAEVDQATHTGMKTGEPAEDWWDGCMWRTENVSVTRNTIDLTPSAIPGCNPDVWPACGAGGIFSEYGTPSKNVPAWWTPTQITFFQGNEWSDNVYRGPSTFFAWNQGNGDNPVNWEDWTDELSEGDSCSSAHERQSGYCTGPFGQDRGSTYQFGPPA